MDTNDIKEFSYDNQIDYFKKMKAGDKKAREELIINNTPLVKYVVWKKIMPDYNVSVKDADDLVQIGIVQLIKCIDNYEIEKNVKFSSFAIICIYHFMFKTPIFLRHNFLIRLFLNEFAP